MVQSLRMAAKYRVTTLGCKVNQYETQQIRELLEGWGLEPAAARHPADLAVVNGCAVTATADYKTRQAVRRAANRGCTPVVIVGCSATAAGDRLAQIPGVCAVIGHTADLRAALYELVVHRLKFGLSAPAKPACEPAAGVAHEPAYHQQRNDGWMNPAPGTQRPSPQRQAPWAITLPIMDTVSDNVKTSRDTERHEHHFACDTDPHTDPPVDPTPLAGITRFDGHQRAFLKVQDGCDAYCTYCLIPKLRPALRSKPVAEVVREAAQLVEAGHREIILTGVFLGAYGQATARRARSQAPPQLPALVAAVADVPGLARLRLSSLEPMDVTEQLLAVLRENPTCVPHLHLPLQSGSAAVLRRMNRQYQRDQYARMVAMVRAALDEPALTTDVIVGFPGETDADFADTVEMVEEAGFMKVHAFPFSPRPGTAAARRRDQFIPKPVVRERMQQLADVEARLAGEYRQRLVGRRERVLLEQPSAGAPGLGRGRADRYVMVETQPADRPLQAGELVEVRIAEATPTGVRGELTEVQG